MPTLRIENRVLPAGPTVADEMANAALFFGLMASLADSHPEVANELHFDAAKGNFFAAARDGLGAKFAWLDGRSVDAPTLIAQELVPPGPRGPAIRGNRPGRRGALSGYRRGPRGGRAHRGELEPGLPGRHG